MFIIWVHGSCSSSFHSNVTNNQRVSPSKSPFLIQMTPYPEAAQSAVPAAGGEKGERLMVWNGANKAPKWWCSMVYFYDFWWVYHGLPHFFAPKIDEHGRCTSGAKGNPILRDPKRGPKHLGYLERQVMMPGWIVEKPMCFLVSMIYLWFSNSFQVEICQWRGWFLLVISRFPYSSVRIQGGSRWEESSFLGSQIWDSPSKTKAIIEKPQISMSYHIKIWSHVLIETPIEPGTRPFQVLPNHHWNGTYFDAEGFDIPPGKAMFHDQDLLVKDPKPANPDESQLVVISTENAMELWFSGVDLSYLSAHVCPTKPWFDATPMLIDELMVDVTWCDLIAQPTGKLVAERVPELCGYLALELAKRWKIIPAFVTFVFQTSIFRQSHLNSFDILLYFGAQFGLYLVL